MIRLYDTELTPQTGKTFLEQNGDGTRIPQDDPSVSIYFESIDLSTHERYFDESGLPQIREIPLKSNDELFQIEMSTLNDKHYQDVLDATNSYNIAKARDGSTETEKVIAARAKISDIDTQYEVDQLAIINKYYGA